MPIGSKFDRLFSRTKAKEANRSEPRAAEPKTKAQEEGQEVQERGGQKSSTKSSPAGMEKRLGTAKQEWSMGERREDRIEATDQVNNFLTFVSCIKPASTKR